MKKYIRPKIEVVDLKVEERLAHSVCSGSCEVDMVYEGVNYYVGTAST